MTQTEKKEIQRNWKRKNGRNNIKREAEPREKEKGLGDKVYEGSADLEIQEIGVGEEEEEEEEREREKEREREREKERLNILK